jgi:YVTN family beta-propeller protein
MKSRDFYTKVLASTSVFLFLILFLSTASASATAQSASTEGIYAYITNQGSDTVSVIDTANNTVAVTVPVGSGPYGVAVSPDGTKAYVTNSASNNVSVIDIANNTVTSTADVGNGPSGVAVNSNGTRIYVTNSVSNNVSVIDTANNTVTATIVVGTNPRGVAVSPDGSKVYVTNYGSSNVSVIDTATNAVTFTVPAGNYPEGIAVNPDGTKVYVVNSWNNTISVVDTANNTVTATIDVGNAPCGVAVIPDGTKAYVTNEKSNTVSVIETAKNTVTATVKVGKSPAGVAVTADGAKVYAANRGSNTVSVIDTTTNKVTTTVNVGSTPVAFGQFIERKPVPFSWGFYPQEPVSGDFLNIDGSASPGEKVDVFVTFEKTVPVSKGKFEYTLEGVKIPEGFNNLFTVEAKGAKNLNVRAKMVLWVTKSSEASGATATVSKSNVPPGTYTIKIDGSAGKEVSEVDLKITAFKMIKADSNGNFSYSYDTTAVPTGDFEVKVGDITKKITIKPEETEPSALVLPAANFSTNVSAGYAPLSVQFNDLSENATGVSWDFGDRKNSTERNPVHKFTTQGTYTVDLTAINGNGTDSKSAIINVTKKPIHWEFSPQEPVSGDILNINGSSSPEEKVDVFATFEKAIPVSKGKFEYTLEGVKIPEGFNNLFTVEAKGAKNLNVRVKMLLWVTKSSEASGDTATVSKSNVPPGTYKIKIDGDAGEEVSEVNLKITALQKIKAGSNGNFNYSFDTRSVPTGDFEVKIGDVTNKITIKLKDNEAPSLVLPVANFSINVTEGYTPLTVQFTDLSENATGWNWDFENDGVIDSIESNPVREFIIPGNYTVNLTATNENGTNSKLATINVSERPIIPVANFSTNISEGYAPLPVQFTDLAENADTVSWDFENDGVIDSTDRNPIHEYTTPGNYTVNLTATNLNGTNSTFATISVLQKPVPVSWGFTPQEPVSGDILNINGNASPGKKVDVFVTFEKTVPVSKGKFEYTLEDVKIPEGFNNLFTVEAKGAKNLNVRVKMLLWVTKSSQATTAIVSQSNVPPGTYTIKIDGSAGKEVSEVDLKITALQKIKADSNGNFSYSYNTTAVPPGNFDVKVGDITKEIILGPEEIEEPALVLPAANFSSDVTEGYAPLTVQFTDLSENATSVSWDFGDGKISTERNPVHKFTTQGTYTVNLTAINGNGTDSKSTIINVTKKPTFPGRTNPPTDPDHDGLDEDVNGNGVLDFNDVVTYYHNIKWIKENGLVAFFDFNNNGLIDFNDVVRLYHERK